MNRWRPSSGSTACRPGAGQRRPVPARSRSEAGFSLPELAVALMLAAILLATAVPVVSTFFSVTVTVNRSYNNENQLLPVATSFQSLIRTAVAPAPALANGEPVPPFGAYAGGNASGNLRSVFSASTLTFFSNVGDPSGPAKVVAHLGQSGGDRTFTVSVAQAVAGSCPGVTTSSLPPTAQCAYGTAHNLFSVNYVVNPTVFTYYLSSGAGKAVTNDAATFGSCTSTSCNAAHIVSVGVDLQVNTSPTSGGQAQDQTVVYELSTSSQLYDPAVG